MSRLCFVLRCARRGLVAANGPRALDLIKEKPYDLLLMGVQMPFRDGMEATLEIRAGRSGVLRPDIPIIALTANAMAEDRERYLTIGMNGHLTKPISRDALQAAKGRGLRFT